MAETVVDGLEVVQVDEEHGDLTRSAFHKSMTDTVVKELSVGEPGERIMKRLVLQSFLECASRG